MIKPIQIGTRTVGPGAPVFYIAEAGVNHNGDVALAHKLVDAAADAGADAVKFQTFKAERLNTRSAPKAAYHVRTTGSDEEQTWFELLKSQELDEPAHQELQAHCARRGVMFLSTPYDEESADLLARLHVDAFKIASTDASNYPFLEYVARKGRPVIYSTGMCEMEEVREGVASLRRAGCRDLVVMQCTSAYPVALPDLNLRVLETYAEAFGAPLGFSDHSDDADPIAPVVAVGAGVSVIEKHFTLDRNLPGPDHQASVEPRELKRMIEAVRKAELTLGSGDKRVLECEVENRRKLRKSVVTTIDVAAGTTLTREMLDCRRPGFGLPPSALEGLIGKRAVASIPADTVIEPSMLGMHRG
jgi:sialic acid synthase SpsE